MRMWMILSMVATLLPMAAWIAWIAPAVRERWRRAGGAARTMLGVAWAASAALLAFPHEDVFTGLDIAAYRSMTHVFLEGRGFHDRDDVLAQVPEGLRRCFYYQPGPLGRPTRDLLFQLSDWNGVKTAPFFSPMMPLAAGGLSPVLSPDRFAPLMGTLWLVLAVSAGFCAGGGWGVLAVAALALGTAWPAWFLRGFYPEGVGATLIAGVMAASAARPMRGGMAAWAGFSLGLAVGYHPTLVILSVPVGLGLMLERRRWTFSVGLGGGALAGLFPFWALTRWVCQPYGDWTRWAALRKLLSVTPEHQAVAIGLSVLAAGGGLLVALFCTERARNWLGAGWRRGSLVALLAAACLATPVAPWLVGGTLLKGGMAVWAGLLRSGAALVLAGGLGVFVLRRPMRERFWLASLCMAALFFMYLKGLEAPAGLWSQRRGVPILLPGIALLAAPLATGLSICAARWRRIGWALALLVAGAGLWNGVRWPAAYFTINERGADAWAGSLEARMGTDRWVVFDYYPHSVPYAAGLKHKVLGLGESSRDRWPEVAGWLSGLSRSQEVWVATSWSPSAMEENARLEEVFAATGRFPVVRTKAFFPAEPGTREVRNTFMRWIPLAPGEAARQDKVLDGSPVGLRGPWGQLRNGSTWTRQGSGILGPVPEKGAAVVFEAECGWSPPAEEWREQVLRVVPPWGGGALLLAVPAGEHRVEGRWVRPAEDGERLPTGVYSMSVERPYDPAEYGLRGYSPDLGVCLRRIIIRIESGGPSVPD